MKKNYILFIDSGVGGLTTLAETYKNTCANFIYFADNKHAPYGAHKPTEICHYLYNIIKEMISKHNICLVVLACNTATTSAITFLREKFNIPIVGTEPAVKLAKTMGFSAPLIIATPRTTKQPAIGKMLINSKLDGRIYGMPHLAKKIELWLKKQSYLTYFDLLKDICYISRLSKRHDCIVLGCTHYVIIKNLIQNFANKPTIDGNVGVSNQVSKLFSGAKKTLSFSKSVRFMCSLSKSNTSQNYRKIFKQILAKR